MCFLQRHFKTISYGGNFLNTRYLSYIQEGNFAISNVFKPALELPVLLVQCIFTKNIYKAKEIKVKVFSRAQ